MVSKDHVDALVMAAIYELPGDFGPLSWFVREMMEEEKAATDEAVAFLAPSF